MKPYTIQGASLVGLTTHKLSTPAMILYASIEFMESLAWPWLWIIFEYLWFFKKVQPNSRQLKFRQSAISNPTIYIKVFI